MFKNVTKNQDLGLLVCRLIVSICKFSHGALKFAGGIPKLIHTGAGLANFGLTEGYLFWGVVAAVTECAGAILVGIGLFSRLVSFLLVCTMIVATSVDAHKGYMAALDPVVYGAIYLMVLIGGPGKYSLDYMIEQRKYNQ